jgi:hypothetical protein
MHLGIARLLGILGRGRCIDDPRLREDRIDDRASRNLKSVGCEVPLCLLKQRPAQIALLQQVTEATHCRLVGHRLAADIDADKATHRVGWPLIASECPPEAAPSQASTILEAGPALSERTFDPGTLPCRRRAGVLHLRSSASRWRRCRRPSTDRAQGAARRAAVGRRAAARPWIRMMANKAG